MYILLGRKYTTTDEIYSDGCDFKPYIIWIPHKTERGITYQFNN